MESILSQLRVLIDNKFIYDGDSGSKITLKEEKEEASCAPFKLSKGNVKTLSLKVDLDDEDVHPMLSNLEKNIKKKPDFIIFCKKPHKQTLFCFIVELKSKRPGDWHRQVNGGLIIAKYLVGMLEHFTRKKITNIEYRCLLFHNIENTPRRKMKSKTSMKRIPYRTHEDFSYKFAIKACNRNYSLPIFMC